MALLLTGCGLQDSRLATQAENQLVGLSELELHLCAGLPSKTETVDGVRLETYETAQAPPNLSLTLPSFGPMSGGGFGVTGAQEGYCRATFALVKEHVTGVYYSGDTATALGLAPLARCGTVVQNCLPNGPSGDRHIKSVTGDPDFSFPASPTAAGSGP